VTEGLVCFNCGTPTDFVGDDGEAICRDCHNARKGGGAPTEEEVAEGRRQESVKRQTARKR